MLSPWIAPDLRNNLLLEASSGRLLNQESLPVKEQHVPLCQFVSDLQSLHDSGQMSLWQSGENFDLLSLGALGQLVATSATLDEALESFLGAFPLVQSTTDARLVVESDQVRCSYKILDPEIWPRQGDSELTLGIIFSICKLFGISRSALSEIHFEHQPSSVTTGGQGRGIITRYGREENAIVFPKHFLKVHKYVSQVDMEAHRTLKRAIEKDIQVLRSQSPLAFRILELLFKQLGEEPLNQDRIADHLCVSGRTLRRILAAEGFSFKDILEKCRRVQAVAFLTRTSAPLSEIAYMLGYSDQAAFSRAFSKWYGMPPKELRRNRPDLINH